MDLMTLPRSDAIAVVAGLLSSGGHLLEVAAQDFINLDVALANGVLQAHMGDRPYYRDNIRDVLGALATPSTPAVFRFGPGAAFSALLGINVAHAFKARRHVTKQNTIIKILPALRIRRAVLSLKAAEKAALQAMTYLFAKHQVTRHEWQTFICALIWNQGREEVVTPEAWRGNRYLDDARKCLDALARALYPDPQAVIAMAGRKLAYAGATP